MKITKTVGFFDLPDNLKLKMFLKIFDHAGIDLNQFKFAIEVNTLDELTPYQLNELLNTKLNEQDFEAATIIRDFMKQKEDGESE